MIKNDHNKIVHIHGINFTSREIDIIACLLHINGRKRIAEILNISPRTVEVHIKNILKKTSKSCQEDIKDFVATADERNLIHKHYSQLLLKKIFLTQLAKISSQLKDQNITCYIETLDIENSRRIAEYLRMAGIITINTPNTSNKYYQLTILNKQQLLVLSQKNNQHMQKKLFLCTNKELRDKFLDQYTDYNVIDCFHADQIYNAVFKIIQRLAPNINLKQDIENFYQQKERVINLKIDLPEKLFIEHKKIGIKTLNNTRIIIAILVITLVLGIAISILGYKHINTTSKMSTNLFFTNETILLKRQEVLKQLSRILKKSSSEINIAVLLGVGGSGKSTIAKQYGRGQKLKIVWLLNAETKQNLMISFETLAYALCDNNMDRQELRNILNLKDNKKQETQLILFTQKQLKQAGKWLLIFDNVTSLQDTANFLPLSPNSWGSGSLIITSRNSNIANHEFIPPDNVIRVGEINRSEKLELFNKITKNSANLQKISQDKIDEFLNKIPSFPLDISLAANYLNFTKASFAEYAQDIQSVDDSFNELQSSILDEVQQYSNTRYNIISVALQDILKQNAEFEELIFLISILDSQEIPKDLLYLTKDRHITNHLIKDLSKNSLIIDTSYSTDQSLNNISLHRSTQNNILIKMLRLLNEAQRSRYITNMIKNIQAYALKKVDLEDILNLKNLIRHCESLLNKDKMIPQNDITSLNTNIGLIYYYLGRDTEAKEVLEHDLNNINKAQELAIIYTHLGAIYRKLGHNYNQAISYLEKALELYDAENYLGKGLALTHLGNTYRTIGNLEKATTILKDSIDTYRRNNTTSVGEIRALGYLGVAYREQGELEAASTCLEGAKAIYEQNGYSQYNSLYAGTLSHLAITYRMVGKYHNAKDVLEKSTEIYKSIRPQDHPDIGRNTLNLGIIYGELREEKQTKAFLEKSLADYERNYGSEHIETGKVLNHLGRFYTLVEEYQKAENVLNRAKQILKKHAHPEYYRSQELMGDINKALFKTEIAKQNYLEALEYAKKYFPQNSSNITRIIKKLQGI